MNNEGKKRRVLEWYEDIEFTIHNIIQNYVHISKYSLL